MKSIYLIGSLRNERIPALATELRQVGYEIFDDWFAAGPEADDWWRTYEKGKGVPYDEALKSYAAKHVFEFDHHHLNRCDAGILVMPAGKSGHLELGYLCGQGKRCYVLFDGEPDRWDVMYQFATGGVFFNVEDLIHALGSTKRNNILSDGGGGCGMGEVHSSNRQRFQIGGNSVEWGDHPVRWSDSDWVCQQSVDANTNNTGSDVGNILCGTRDSGAY